MQKGENEEVLKSNIFPEYLHTWNSVNSAKDTPNQMTVLNQVNRI